MIPKFMLDPEQAEGELSQLDRSGLMQALSDIGRASYLSVPYRVSEHSQVLVNLHAPGIYQGDSLLCLLKGYGGVEVVGGLGGGRWQGGDCSPGGSRNGSGGWGDCARLHQSASAFSLCFQMRLIALEHRLRCKE